MSVESNLYSILSELQKVIQADKDKQKYLNMVKAVGFNTIDEFLNFNYGITLSSKLFEPDYFNNERLLYNT